MKNFNEGMDLWGNSGLAGFPTANKVWLYLCDLAEADVAVTDTISTLTKTSGTSVKSKTGVTCSSRLADLGGPHTWTETAGSPKSVVAATNDPAVGGAKAIAILDINGGSALNLASASPFTLAGWTLRLAYEGET